jgi:HEAT repeat protein
MSVFQQARNTTLPLVPELGVALGHRDLEYRQAALEMLRDFVVVEEQLPELKGDARLAALARLHTEGQIRPVLPFVRQLLSDPDPLTRVFAAEAVWSVCRHPAEPLPVLVGVLHDPEEAVRWHALRVLKSMGREAAAAAPALIACLNERSEFVFDLVEKPLAEMGPEVVPLLVKAMHDRVPRVRQQAIGILSSINPPAVEAMPALSEAIWDKDERVSRAAVEVLYRIKLNSAGTQGKR